MPEKGRKREGERYKIERGELTTNKSTSNKTNLFVEQIQAKPKRQKKIFFLQEEPNRFKNNVLLEVICHR